MKLVLLTTLILVLLLSSFTASAICEADATTNPNQLCNPISGSGRLPVLGLKVLNVFFLLIGGTTIVFVMYAGFRMIVSQGNTEEVAKAKQALQWSISGMVLAMFAYVLVYAISNFIGVKPFDAGSFEDPPASVINPITSNDFGQLITRMIQGFLGVVGALALLLIVINGFRYITSGGNEEQSEQAKKGLQWSVLGLIVSLFAYVLVRSTATFFGVK